MIRISAILESELYSELVAAIAGLDVSLNTIRVQDNFCDMAEGPKGVLIVSLRQIPVPMVDTVDKLRELKGERRVIVVYDDASPRNGLQELIETFPNMLMVDIATAQGKDDLRDAIDELSRDTRSPSESSGPAAQLSDFDSQNAAMQRFMEIANRVAAADSSLLILGETGVGKERLARAIHSASPRCDGPFVAVNCAAFPESLLESELFGHEKGAFTGAVAARRGYFEMAQGGTLFLDEIGEVHPCVQVKLLRVIQERTIQRLGGESQIPINVRIMSATNRNLKLEVEQERFRRDLYYRLSVVALEIPSLREHPEDIYLLLQKYLVEFRRSLSRAVNGFSSSAITALQRYQWPGNIRELINIVERSILLSSGPKIELSDLPPEVVVACQVRVNALDNAMANICLPTNWIELPWTELRKLVVSQYELKFIRHHLEFNQGRIGEISKKASLSHRAVNLMLKRHGLNKNEYRIRKSPALPPPISTPNDVHANQT